MIISKLSNIANDINKVLLPTLCFGCMVRLSRGEQMLCTVCRNHLPLTEYDFERENAVDRIFFGRTPIRTAAAMLFYDREGIVKNLIHALKYKGQQQVGEFLGDWFGELLKDCTPEVDFDYVIPVPLHPKKLRKRGYNQVEGFGLKLAFHLQAKYRDDLLIKTANSRTQTKKNRLYRWMGNQALYQLKDPSALENRQLLLVDDVITTGATLEACSEALHKAPDVSVSIAAMAVVP
ncbi:ComF family protein [Lentiprolixibacter aurantiacus]|uniref:ComF family protein n=1 Tax=Lentiprolixibacter aurantiacus TaxID=2993939 RepID=A0AAE3MJ82_9FLAO|nr:ComF family protein [Lentiprolixibacter aurantiacus]MCX2718311.1 ComF family protein [Lentiprolixibacter aurantiacus]